MCCPYQNQLNFTFQPALDKWTVVVLWISCIDITTFLVYLNKPHYCVSKLTGLMDKIKQTYQWKGTAATVPSPSQDAAVSWIAPVLQKFRLQKHQSNQNCWQLQTDACGRPTNWLFSSPNNSDVEIVSSSKPNLSSAAITRGSPLYVGYFLLDVTAMSQQPLCSRDL